MASTKMKPTKTVASKQLKFSGYEPTSKPSVKIMKCIGFQKFRYCGENRPGKKYQDKDFMTLALCHMSGKNVRVQIVCFNTERQDDIHPNGLVGKDCQYGVYDKMYPISKATQIIRIPYLRTERILTKKTNKDESKGSQMSQVFVDRAKILPSPYKERCQRQAQADQRYDTTRVCFGVIVSMEQSSEPPLFCISNVVQNASEKTMLKILKLSTQYVSAQEGGEIDIFTSEDGPAIIPGKCSLKVMTYTSEGDLAWESTETTPMPDNILYKRVVTYRVPAYLPNPATDSPVRAMISLSCMQSGQTCTHDVCYEPGADSARKLATIHSNKPLRKRPYMSEPMNDENRYDDIKLQLKEKVRSRQNQAEPVVDSHKVEPAHIIQEAAVSNGFSPAIAVTSGEQDSVPLHQQEDIVLAKDMVTGEVVYIRTQQAQDQAQPQTQTLSSNLFMYIQEADLNSSGGITLVSDTSQALSAYSTATSSLATSTAVKSFTELVSSDQAGPSTRKKSKFVSPWIVGEPETTPMVNGDISFSQQQRKEAPPLSGPMVTFGEVELKREPFEMGPPILTPPASGVQISSETVPGVSNNLPSGTLISNPNLPSLSLNSLLATGILEGVRFDDSGTLLSSSVFEMVKPYM